MPIYNYFCDKCEEEFQEFRNLGNSVPGPICKCGKEMERIPSAPMPTIIHFKDPVRGKNFREGVTKQLKKRAHEHFLEHEVDDLVEEHGLKHAKDLGWVDRKTGRKKKLIDEK